MKLLLVDDSESTRFIHAALLQQYAYDVIEAEDGEQAWELLQIHPDISLLLTDWMMPRLSGPDLCRRIREQWPGQYIYCILLTQKEQKSALIEGMEAGADDFLSKPVEPEELRVRLQAGCRVIELESRLAEHNRRLNQAYNQIQGDLQAAAKTQYRVLPQPAELQGYQFDWWFQPSQMIGGDMLNYFQLNEEYIGFYQLDVSGHGIRSALMSFALHSQISSAAQGVGLLLEQTAQGLKPRSPAIVVSELNQRFQADDDDFIYFTLIYGLLHSPSGHICLTQAGHPPPLLKTADGKVQAYGDGGFPVGMLPESTYQEQHLSLRQGEQLLLYSDGVTDCCREQGDEVFGLQRLQDYWASMRLSPDSKSLQKFGEHLQNWQQSSDFEDDVSLLSISRL